MKTLIHLLILTFSIFSFSFLSAQAWEEQATGTLEGGYFLSAISVVDENIVWAVAYNIIDFNQQNISIEILKTDDGGETWVCKKVGEFNERISVDIEALDSNSAFITTCTFNNMCQGILFKTEDGGDTWTENFSHPVAGRWIEFLNDMEGLIINERNVATTIDGGDSWQLVNSSYIPSFLPGEELFGIFPDGKPIEVSGNNVWFGTNMGRVFKSKDKGFSWEVYNTPLSSVSSIKSIVFRDSLNGILVGNDPYDSPFSITNDGGETWNSFISYPGLSIKHLEVVPGTNGHLIGTSGTTGAFNRVSAYSDDFGKNWNVIDKVIPSGDYRFIPFGSVEFISPNIGWVIRNELRFSTETPIYKWSTNTSVNAKDTSSESKVSIFPNPSAESISINSSKKLKKYNLFTIDGKLIQSSPLGLYETEIYIGHLDHGSFLLELFFSDDTRYTEEIIKVD